MTKKKTPAWQGASHLEAQLVPLDDLDLGADPAGDLDSIKRQLEAEGQLRPVLLGNDGRTIVKRAHLYLAALDLGWTHIAARPEALDDDAVHEGQGGLFDSLLTSADAEDREKLLAAVGKKGGEADDHEIEEINDTSAQEKEWVALPEFVPTTEALKVVVQCDTEAERDALLDALGIATIHKGTRGTLSVWWPDREKKDLASLRFVETDR